MGPALIGLAGVVVGVVISGLSAFLATRRAERTDARAAARLLQAELAVVGRALQRMTVGVEASFHGSDFGKPRLTYYALRELSDVPTSELWVEHRRVLARALGTSQWYAVASAYENLELLRGAAADRELLDMLDGDREFDALDDPLRELAIGISEGEAALAVLAGHQATSKVVDPWVAAIHGRLRKAANSRAVDDAVRPSERGSATEIRANVNQAPNSDGHEEA